MSEAKRELYEETGLKAKKWRCLGHFFVAPGHETTDIQVFLASGFQTNHRRINTQDGDEAIQKIVEVTIEELPMWIIKG